MIESYKNIECRYYNKEKDSKKLLSIFSARARKFIFNLMSAHTFAAMKRRGIQIISTTKKFYFQTFFERVLGSTLAVKRRKLSYNNFR